MKWRVLDWRRVDWEQLNRFGDRTVFQTKAWLEFVADTQNAEPIVAALEDGGSPIGYFSGLVIRRFGIRILGSPFPGWTSTYMAFNTASEADRLKMLAALPELAFNVLGCMHVELMDLAIPIEEAKTLGYTSRPFETFRTDLTQGEDRLFASMDSDCRRCIRKSQKDGVVIEECRDDAFAAQYYDQLKEVFARQNLVPTYPIARVQSLIGHLRPTESLLLLRALAPDRRCIATGIYVAYNKLAVFWGNASHTGDRHYRPNEALHWYALRYWKNRGIETFDWGGGGQYKAKYGPQRVDVPWIRKSRLPAIEQLRAQARRVVDFRQRLYGRIQGRGVPIGVPGAIRHG